MTAAGALLGSVRKPPTFSTTRGAAAGRASSAGRSTTEVARPGGASAAAASVTPAAISVLLESIGSSQVVAVRTGRHAPAVHAATPVPDGSPTSCRPSTRRYFGWHTAFNAPGRGRDEAGTRVPPDPGEKGTRPGPHEAATGRGNCTTGTVRERERAQRTRCSVLVLMRPRPWGSRAVIRTV